MKFKRVSIFTLSAMVALLSGSVFAKSYSTPESEALVVADGKIGQRICYYEDKAYTAGAVIKSMMCFWCALVKMTTKPMGR